MANEFPHVQFRGIDIGAMFLTTLIPLFLNSKVTVPIATRYPPRNVRIEMHDANEPLRWHDNTVDLVHVRNMWMAVSMVKHSWFRIFLLTSGFRPETTLA